MSGCNRCALLLLGWLLLVPPLKADGVVGGEQVCVGVKRVLRMRARVCVYERAREIPCYLN